MNTTTTRNDVKRHMVNYLIACHSAALDLDADLITDEEYNQIISWRLEDTLKIIDEYALSNTKEQGAKK